MSKIVVVTDCDFNGSGYYYIAMPLFTKLAQMGHEIRIVGLSYDGQEHNHPFSIIPARDTNDVHASVHNLCQTPATSPDVIIVAMDIPLQIFFRDKFAQYKKPYIAITPLENGPLRAGWTAQLFNMDWVYFISELGKQEALKAGLTKVDHLQIGIDTNFWRVPTQEERVGLRKGIGIEDGEFVILTVAANQERKNWWAALSVTSELKKRGCKVRHIVVTDPVSQFGWDIRDLAMSLDINKEVMTMKKGIPIENLWSLYALSDCFLLTSKGEGLGLPVLEAMASGTPVVATDTGAITELLECDRGFLIPAEYVFTDVWGNSTRHMIDIQKAVSAIYEFPVNIGMIIENARKFVMARTWDAPAEMLDKKIKELIHDNTTN